MFNKKLKNRVEALEREVVELRREITKETIRNSCYNGYSDDMLRNMYDIDEIIALYPPETVDGVKFAVIGVCSYYVWNVDIIKKVFIY